MKNINQFDMEVRTDFWLRHFKDVADLPGCIYGLSVITPYGGKSDKLDIAYITAVDTPDNLSCSEKGTIIMLGEGDYIRFDYTGTAEGFQPFIIAVNQYHLPRLGVVRRKGADIERYYLRERTKSSWRSRFLHCSYFIPCANADAIDLRIRKQN